MSWDNNYRSHKYLWGKRPSELASFAVDYLQQSQSYLKAASVLDIGCGYGRDTLYLSQHIHCTILGIDNSQEAIEMATQGLRENAAADVEFQCCDFARLGPSKYDIVFISNLYHLLEPQQRTKLRETVKRILQPGGLLFLSTLSVSDPEHYGKGTPIVGEVNSFLDERYEKYLHFCTREELERDFSFLTIKELQQHEYHELRSTGETHHHISWSFVGESPVTGL